VDQYAIENGKKTSDAVGTADWTNYLKKDTALFRTAEDVFGNGYGEQTVDSLPKVPQATYDALSDVTDATFWSPFNP
jgi:hypothetical protein